MKGILKIYHPEEILKYHIKSTYCKAIYSNEQHFLEVEIITDDALDHVEDDSIQFKFPQISLKIFDFLIDTDDVDQHTFEINDTEDEVYTEVDLYTDDDAYITNNILTFSRNTSGDLQVIWKGEINDFYTDLEEPLTFQLKCSFTPDEIVIDEE